MNGTYAVAVRYPYRSPATADNFSIECVAWSVRTVPDFERMTSEAVSAPPER